MTKSLLKFGVNTSGRDFVVGDIHGMYDLLMTNLDKIDFDGAVDRLFSVGDLIDRGPKSYECLNLCYEPWFHAVRGNHEQMMFDVIVLKLRDRGLWERNGGTWAHGDDAFKDKLTPIANDLYYKMPYGIQVTTKTGRTIGIVHADVESDRWEDNFQRDIENMHQYTQSSLLWSRVRIKGHMINSKDVEGVDCLYVGHTPVKEPVQMRNVHYIDTGSVWSNRIEIIELT